MGTTSSQKILSEEERIIKLKPEHETKQVTEKEYKNFYNTITVLDVNEYSNDYWKNIFKEVRTAYPEEKYSLSQVWNELKYIRKALLDDRNLNCIRLQLLCLAKWYVYTRDFKVEKLINKAFISKIKRTDCKYFNEDKLGMFTAKDFIKNYDYVYYPT